MDWREEQTNKEIGRMEAKKDLEEGCYEIMRYGMDELRIKVINQFIELC